MSTGVRGRETLEGSIDKGSVVDAPFIPKQGADAMSRAYPCLHIESYDEAVQYYRYFLYHFVVIRSLNVILVNYVASAVGR